jgi:hypothetical protein
MTFLVLGIDPRLHGALAILNESANRCWSLTFSLCGIGERLRCAQPFRTCSSRFYE